MRSLLGMAQTVLRASRYYAEFSSGGSPEALVFENDTVLGFVLGYEDVEALLHGWRVDSQRLIDQNQLSLRRSMDKVWNAYLVLLSGRQADRLQQSLLDSIEENLIGTRKIARSGVSTETEMARALLPLLPLQRAPVLGPVDMEQEIRIRTSQLPSSIIDAFFSTRDPGTIMQLLEER